MIFRGADQIHISDVKPYLVRFHGLVFNSGREIRFHDYRDSDILNVVCELLIDNGFAETISWTLVYGAKTMMYRELRKWNIYRFELLFANTKASEFFNNNFEEAMMMWKLTNDRL